MRIKTYKIIWLVGALKIFIHLELGLEYSLMRSQLEMAGSIIIELRWMRFYENKNL